MSNRRLSLTFGLLLTITGAISLAGYQTVSAQQSVQKKSVPPAGQTSAPVKTDKQDDGPVALTPKVERSETGAIVSLGPNQLGNFGPPMINNKGDVAFIGRYMTDKPNTLGSGFFTYRRDGTWTSIHEGDKEPNLNATIINMGTASINDDGDVTFIATVDKPVPDLRVAGSDVVVSKDMKLSGVFTKSAKGVIKKIATIGEEVPNTPSLFLGFSNSSMNTKGVLTFIGTYTDPDGRGMFVLENGKLSLVARSGQRSPAGTDTIYSEHFYPSNINERGELAFFCRISGGGAIMVRRPTGVEAIAVQDKPSPIPGSNYIGFGNRSPAINNKGEVAFVGFIDGEKYGRVLFFKGEGPAQVVARSGDTVPDTQTTFTDFSMPSVNSKGEIVFVANYAGRARGVFLKTAAGIEPIALYEKAVPGMEKGERNIFNNFINPVINENGDIVFMSQIRNNSVGIFLKKKGEPLKAISRTGDMAPFK